MTPEEHSRVVHEIIEAMREQWGESSLSVDDQFGLAVRCVLLQEMWTYEKDLCNRSIAWIATVRNTVDPSAMAAADQLLAEWSELRESDAG